MRLVARFSSEKESRLFFEALCQYEIESSVEMVAEDASGKNTGEKGEGDSASISSYAPTSVIVYLVWVQNEDDFERALGLYEVYRKDREGFIKGGQFGKKFFNSEMSDHPLDPSSPPPSDRPLKESFRGFFAKSAPGGDNISEKERKNVRRFFFPLTLTMLALCSIFFILNTLQTTKVERVEGPFAFRFGFSPIGRTFYYDYPEAFENLHHLVTKYHLQSQQDIASLPLAEKRELLIAEGQPYWTGLQREFVDFMRGLPIEFFEAPMFEKIQKGEVWRIVTPILLHGDFLHILFNMLWLFLLLPPIESRLGVGKALSLLVVLAAFSNTMQYLMTGFSFVGFSGVLCGLAGYIWVRQKEAPWEGYAVARSSLRFLFFFILGLVVIDILLFMAQISGMAPWSTGIGNASHLSGLLLGFLLGKSSLFARKEVR